MARSSSFAGGAALLGVVGLACSALGSIFRILLAHVIGDAGIAYYQIAYPIFSFLAVIATVGIPAAISKQIAYFVAREDYKNAHSFFITSLHTLLIAGLLLSGLMALLSDFISSVQGVPDGGALILSVSPALLFAFVICAIRGYFQGLMRMEPTAHSLVIEEVVKSAAGYALMLLYLSGGTKMAAMGALWGIPIAEACAALYLFVRYLNHRDVLRRFIRQTPKGYAPVSARERLRTLWKLSLPITLSASVLPLVSLLDNLIVINALKAYGFSQAMAQMRFGLLAGIIAPVVFVPMALGNALQMSLVPAVSASAALGRHDEVDQHVRIGVKLALLIGLPCAVGLYLLGPPLLRVLFYKTLADEATMTLATTLVRLLGAAVGFLIMAQTTNGILQGVGDTNSPLTHLLGGAAIKVVLSIGLMSMFTVHITGAAIGTLACFAYIAMINLVRVRKLQKKPFGFERRWLAIILASALMGAAALGSYSLCLLVLPMWLGVVIGILTGIICYAFLILRLRIIGSEDCRLIPGGLWLDSEMHRIGWWR
jgi:stage V sporulation protein B